MEKEQFLTVLRDELIKRGIPPETAQRHVRSIGLTLSPEDIRELESLDDPGEISALAEGIAKVKLRTATKEPAVPAAPSADTTVIPQTESEAIPLLGAQPSLPFEADEPEDDRPSDIGHGRTVFWVLFFVTLPLSLLFLALYVSVFGLMFGALCAVIILLVAGLIGGVAAGAAVSLVGIIYGITQLITAPSAAPGLYEVGLGLTIAGIVMLGGILVYNCAIRLIPYLIRLLGVLFRFCAAKLKQLFKMAKEACYKL